MITDASLGFSVVAYRIAAIVSACCEALGGILPPLDGNVSKGHEASTRRNLIQRAKVGCCPFCFVATHVATPLKNSRSEYDELEERGAAL